MAWIYFQGAGDSRKDCTDGCARSPTVKSSEELHAAPIWDDVCTLRGNMLPVVDIIAGGFPCQDISVAGTGKGLEGDRSGLVFEYLRLISECRPKFVFMENVAALAIRGLDRVLLGLDALGYDARWTVVSAAEMGAPHIRERIWILAHANDSGRIRQNQFHDDAGRPEIVQQRTDSLRFARNAHGTGTDADPRAMATAARERRREWRSEPISTQVPIADCKSSGLADTTSKRLERRVDAGTAWKALALGSGSGSGSAAWPSWLPKPAIRRDDDGMGDRVNRLRILGNGVVPVCAAEAFERLMGLK